MEQKNSEQAIKENTKPFVKEAEAAKAQISTGNQTAKSTVRRAWRIGPMFSRFMIFGLGVASVNYLGDQLKMAQVQIMMKTTEQNRKQTNIFAKKSNGSNSPVKVMDSQEWFNSLLTKENVSAFKIQCSWRQNSGKIKNYQKHIESKTYDIKFYMTSLNTDIHVQEANERIQHILDTFQLSYKVYDLYQYDHKILCQDIVNKHGGSSKLPMVFINDTYIGGINQIQDLVDEERFMDVVHKIEEKIKRNTEKKKREEEKNLDIDLLLQNPRQHALQSRMTFHLK